MCVHCFVGRTAQVPLTPCLQPQQLSELKKWISHSSFILCFYLNIFRTFSYKVQVSFQHFSVFETIFLVLLPFLGIFFAIPVLLRAKWSEISMVSENEFAGDLCHTLMAFSGLFLTNAFLCSFGHIQLLGWHFQGFLSWRCIYKIYICT